MSGYRRELDGRIKACRKDSQIYPEPQERELRVGKKDFVQNARVDLATDQSDHRNGKGKKRLKRLITEKPLGTVFEILEEPDEEAVDVEGEADKAACRCERDGWSSLPW